MFSYLKNMIRPCEIFISRSNRHIVGKLNTNSAKLHVRLLDVWELTLEIPKAENNYYGFVKQYMEIFVPNVGWFRINGHPIESMDYATGMYTKQVTAYGYETQLQDIDLNLFYINTGEPLSMEMYEENLDALGVPKHNIQLYIDNATEELTSNKYWGLGLLNILEHEYLKQKGWTIGHVDTGLKGLRGRMFQIDSQDVYSFLTQEASKAYKCVFIFDNMNKTINAYQVDNLGKYLNVELNRKNLLNSVTIESQKDCSCTQFLVAGGSDETTISYVNFGSETIENLSYYMANGQLSPDYLDRYNTYVDYRESRRDEYADTVRDYLTIQQKIDVIYQQIPIDECSKKWSSYTTEELETELEQFQKLQEALEQAHTVDGVLQIEETPDYAIYISIKEAIIPSITQILDARATGEAEKELDYKVNWELYGIDELTTLKKNYENQVSLLAKKGYDNPWKESDESNKETHTKHYEDYLLYQQYIEEIDVRLAVLNEKVDAYKIQLNELEELRKSIANDVNIENARFGFSQEELSDIYSLYINTAFTDSSIEVQSMDDIDAVIELSKELLDSANKELEIESRPQLRFSVNTENPFLLEKFSKVIDDMDVGDFIYLDIDDSAQSNWRNRKPIKVKQRIIEYTTELVDLNDTSCEFEFSDMVHCYGVASDDEYLLGNGRSSQKNSVSKSVSNYVNSAASTIASQVLSSYLKGGNSLFLGNLSTEDVQKLADALDGLINGTMSLEELTVKVAQIGELKADCAFIKYLNTQYLVAEQADFVKLHAKVAMIDNLLAGNISAELGHLIRLTAKNVSIEEAVIKDIIAASIMVSDLKAGDITINNNMRILSEDGMMIMNGETFQILGTDSNGNQYVAIQLGYDAKKNPSLIIRDANGAVMLDGSGLHENIVPDGLIVTNMIKDGAVTEDKIDKKNIHEWTDDNGNKVFDVSKMYYGNDKFETSFTSIKTDINQNKTEISSVKARVDQAEKSIELCATTSEMNTKIEGVKNELIDMDAGLDKWKIEIYKKSSLPEENRESPTLDAFFGKQIKPNNVYTVLDSSLSTSFSYGNDYIGYGVTFVNFSSASTVSTTFSAIGESTLYLNGSIKTPDSSGNVSLSFTSGWNIIEVVWNVSTDVSSGGFRFGTTISTNSKCTLMNCFYQSITSRQTNLIDKYAGTRITVDSIETRLSVTESTLIKKADGEEVQTLRTQLNESISDVASWKQTISETYADKNSIVEVKSSIEQLKDSLKTYVTADKVSTMIEQSNNQWRIDFSENGATCGTISMTKEGISVSGTQGSGYKTTITSSEFSGWYNNTKVFYLNQDETVSERLRVNKGIDLRTIKLVPVTQDNYRGLDFLGGNAII